MVSSQGTYYRTARCVGQGRQPNEDGTEDTRDTRDTHRLKDSFTFTPIVLAGFLQLERIAAPRTAVED